MKINIKLLSIILLILGLQSCKSKIKKEVYFSKDLKALVSKLDSLSSLKTLNSKTEIKETLSKMLESPDEEVILKTFEYYYTIGDTLTNLDSISNLTKERFPKGLSARFKEYQFLWDQETPEAKKSAYNAWKAKFPPKNFSINERGIYNMILRDIASLYIEEGKTNEAEQIIAEFIDNPQISISYYVLANSFFNKKDYEKTYIYLDKCIEKSKKTLQNKEVFNNTKKLIKYNIKDAYRTYAVALCENGKYQEAIPFFKKYDALKVNDDAMVMMHIDALKETHQIDEAIDKATQLITKDFGSKEEYTLLKSLYITKNRGLKGYEAFAKKLEKEIRNNLSEKIKKSIIDEPLPADVTFTTMDGKLISLEDLKGNILIIDFWASWCGPCKASFPAMQAVKNYYKSDSKIKFLFLNTLESHKGAARITAIKKILKAYNCEDFDVFLDEKNSNDFKMAQALNVTAIPLKIIIDSKGHIRYKSIGYSGDLKIEENKMKAIIEMVKTLDK